MATNLKSKSSFLSSVEQLIRVFLQYSVGPFIWVGVVQFQFQFLVGTFIWGCAECKFGKPDDRQMEEFGLGFADLSAVFLLLLDLS